MSLSFSGDLEELWTTEGALQRSHEEPVAHKQQSIDTAQERASTKEEQKASVGQEPCINLLLSVPVLCL